MDNSFKNNIEQELHGLSMEPSENVWFAVEKELDKKKRRRFFGWWLFPLLLAGTGIIFYFNSDKEAGKNFNSENNKLIAADKSSKHTDSTQLVTIKDKSILKDSTTHTQDIDSIENINKKSKQSRRTNAKTKMKIYAPTAVDEMNEDKTQSLVIEEKVTTVLAEKIGKEKEKIIIQKDVIEQDSLQFTDVTKTDSTQLTKQQEKTEDEKTPLTINSDSIIKTKKEKKNRNALWKKEWSVLAGRSTLAGFNSLGSNNNTYDSPGTIGGPIPGGSIVLRERIVIKFEEGIFLGAGFNIGRPLSKKISLFTGLRYNYQSAKAEKTTYTDSLISNGSSYAYNTIRSNIDKQDFYQHHINIPLLLNFSFHKNLNVSTGLYNNISLASNWKNFEPILGRQQSYLPVFHLNTTYAIKDFFVGPFLNIGLRKYPIEKRFMQFGLILKYGNKK